MDRKIHSKRGKVKVQIVAGREKPKTLLGATKGTFKILGDIVGPLADEEYDEDREWRNVIGQFDHPARYTPDHVAERGPAEPRKDRKPSLRRRTRSK